jgi:hypothetical protein
LYAYTRTYPDNSRKTEAWVAKTIRSAINDGKTVAVDTATTGRINAASTERPLQMKVKIERLFAEAAAIMNELEKASEGNVYVLNKDVRDLFF